jgi:hypothetical protein
VAGLSKTQLLTTVARMFMQALSDVFGTELSASGIWPARSPVLVIFFFWGCLKD